MSRNSTTMIPKRIASIRFGLMDPTEIRKMSSVEVKTADTYKDDGHAYRQGLMDPHMGVIEPGLLCPTDNCKYDESPGHFGHIQLELPVIHIGFVNLIKTALKATCNSCSKILLHDADGTHPSNPGLSEQDYYRARVRDIITKHGVGSTEFSKIIKEIEKKTSEAKRTICMHCKAQQGKIVLDKPTTFKENIAAQGGGKATERKLNARDIREWLQGIPKEHLIFLGMNKENRPEWIILKVLPVPPITVRPSITLDSGDRSEDDLTHKLVDVLRINQRLRENRDAGAPQLIVEDLWELLQYHVTTYFDNQTSGIPPARHRSGRTLKTLTQRLKGKEGRFRSNLSGKRVNFCARSVISPDPYLGVNEVGVPTKIAKELTVPIRVTTRNREQMRQMILRGPDVHPGVNYVIRGDKRRVRINQRSRLINAGFRCHNPECMEETTQRFDLHQVLPAPNFLPGLVVKKFVSREEAVAGGEELVTYAIDDAATIANLRGEDIDGNPLAEDDPRSIMHRRWKFELANPDTPYPEGLEVTCPHCGSPDNEWGERTRVEDRLSTVDMNGNPKPGLLVERHLIDGDVVIFNRQPSLHRMSMMVHEVRVMKGHTFRFNLAVCTPYNADFDGDEMNLHVIQGEEAVAGGEELVTYAIDDAATIANLRGEDIDGNPLAEDDPRSIMHRRWKFELANPDTPYPEGLEVTCPHCLSPDNEWGERTRVEDRLSTVDMNGNPKPGLLVERHLIDGDVVIFNRQPSLHRMSMMVHEVRVMKGHTFRFNLAVCTPYNADFDGDEMNLHVIQGEEARAEAKILMRVQEHILTPRYGGAVIGGIHDHISGAYLLSRPGTQISKRNGLEMLGNIGYTGELPEVHTGPNGEYFNGEDLISVIIPKNIHLRFRSRSNDDVVVKNGKVTGTLDKRAIGAEDGRLLDAIVQTNGPTEGAKFLDEFTRLSIGACTSLGFTTGIDDEDLSAEALSEIERHNAEARAEVQAELDKFGKDGRGYDTRPGRTPKETLEENIMVILDLGKQAAGDVAKDELNQSGNSNAAVGMAISGARGSMDNLTMMAGSIGQAKVRGARLERGYHQRVLPHFKRGGLGAPEKGFISSSFKRGLEPTEFFMLSVSGRESLVDTAVRTSKSGYMQRRLINAMDDLKVYNDDNLSVRNTANRIIQFQYGEDGIDPSRGVHGKPFNIDVVVDEALGTDGPTKKREEEVVITEDKNFDLGFGEGDSEAAAGGEL